MGSSRNDDVDLEMDELGRDLGGALGAPLRPAILNRDGAALDPAKLTQSLHQSSGPWMPSCSVRTQEPDGRQSARWLRPRPERPPASPLSICARRSLDGWGCGARNR